MTTLKRMFGIVLLLGTAVLMWQVLLDPQEKNPRWVVQRFSASKKVAVRSFQLEVINSSVLGPKQLSTSIEASGFYHASVDGIFSLNFQNVRGSLSGQGDVDPHWDHLNQGSVILKTENDQLLMAWVGETLGEIEVNALRLLVGTFPPLEKFSGISSVSYERKDLYSYGKWIWMPSDLGLGKTKWSSSYLPIQEGRLGNYLTRQSSWQILNENKAWEVTGHDLLEIPSRSGHSVAIDVKTDLKLLQETKIPFNVDIYKNLSFIAVSETPQTNNKSFSQKSNSLAEQPSKSEFTKNFSDGKPVDYLELRKSFDTDEWQVKDIDYLFENVKLSKENLNQLLAALSQTRWEGGKTALLQFMKSHWNDESNLVNFLPLMGQGPVYSDEAYRWLKMAGKSHTSNEVKATAILARGTLAYHAGLSDEQIRNSLVNDLLLELAAANDANQTQNLLAALGNAGGDNLSSKLSPWLSRPEPSIRAQAYFSVRNARPIENALEILIKGLSDSHRLVRLKSAQALAEMDLGLNSITTIKPFYEREKDSQVKIALSELVDRI